MTGGVTEESSSAGMKQVSVKKPVTEKALTFSWRGEFSHSVFICLSSITLSFFLFFTFLMTSIAFKVHINDN